jgi:hypothetical protein
MAEAISARSKICGDACVCDKLADCVENFTASKAEAWVLRWLGPPCLVAAASVIAATAFSCVAVLFAGSGLF